MKQIGWFVFQTAVVLGVGYAISTDPKLDNVSAMAIGVAGIFCAWFLTLCLVAIGDLFRWILARRRRRVVRPEEWKALRR